MRSSGVVERRSFACCDGSGWWMGGVGVKAKKRSGGRGGGGAMFLLTSRCWLLLVRERSTGRNLHGRIEGTRHAEEETNVVSGDGSVNL